VPRTPSLTPSMTNQEEVNRGGVCVYMHAHASTWLYKAPKAYQAGGWHTGLAWGCRFMAGGGLVAAHGLVPCRPYVPVITGFGAFSTTLPVLILPTQTVPR
jgi:hypothetical protein